MNSTPLLSSWVPQIPNPAKVLILKSLGPSPLFSPHPHSKSVLLKCRFLHYLGQKEENSSKDGNLFAKCKHGIVEEHSDKEWHFFLFQHIKKCT